MYVLSRVNGPAKISKRMAPVFVIIRRVLLRRLGFTMDGKMWSVRREKMESLDGKGVRDIQYGWGVQPKVWSRFRAVRPWVIMADVLRPRGVGKVDGVVLLWCMRLCRLLSMYRR